MVFSGLSNATWLSLALVVGVEQCPPLPTALLLGSLGSPELQKDFIGSSHSTFMTQLQMSLISSDFRQWKNFPSLKFLLVSQFQWGLCEWLMVRLACPPPSLLLLCALFTGVILLILRNFLYKWDVHQHIDDTYQECFKGIFYCKLACVIFYPTNWNPILW